MQEQLWAQLTADFPLDATEWRVVEVSEDKRQARVSAQLHVDAVTERLNRVLGVMGWSNNYIPLRNDAVGCNLSIGELSKTSMLPFLDTVDSAVRASDALVKAAESFGIVPAVPTDETYWVDYDAEAGAILFEPDVATTPVTSVPIASASPSLAASPAPAEAAPLVDSANADVGKSEGQKAIDRLIERLKNEGRGLEVTQLVMNYNGYGDSPDASRELYSKLRALLKSGADV